MQLPLWRVYYSGGAYPTQWNEFRYVGPIPKMRFDPYLPPLRVQPRGIMYAAADACTAVAEVFQDTRIITGARGATLVGWQPARELVLLDLTDTYLARAGASASLATGPKRVTQQWAERIDAQFGRDIDGVYYASPMTGRPCFALSERAVDCLPANPAFHRSIDDPAIRSNIGEMAVEIGYAVR